MTDLPPPAPGCEACAAREAEIAAQGEQIAAQQEQIEDLRAKMARLERIVSRDSGNSSMPPSTDDLPGRKPLSRRPSFGPTAPCPRHPAEPLSSAPPTPAT